MCCSVTRKYLLALTWPGSISAPQLASKDENVRNFESIRQTSITLPCNMTEMTALVPDITLCRLFLGRTRLTDKPKLSIHNLQAEITVCNMTVSVTKPMPSHTDNDNARMIKSATACYRRLQSTPRAVWKSEMAFGNACWFACAAPLATQASTFRLSSSKACMYATCIETNLPLHAYTFGNSAVQWQLFRVQGGLLL